MTFIVGLYLLFCVVVSSDLFSTQLSVIKYSNLIQIILKKINLTHRWDPNRVGPRSNVDKRVFHTPLSSRTGVSQPDAVSYQGHPLFLGAFFYPTAGRFSLHNLNLADRTVLQIEFCFPMYKNSNICFFFFFSFLNHSCVSPKRSDSRIGLW